MRNAIACVSCRVSKRQCITVDEKPPCERCKAFGRADSCKLPAPGTSAIHRQSKQARRAAQRSIDGQNLSPLPFRTPSATESAASPKKTSPLAFAAVDLNDVHPFHLFTDDVKNAYLRCSYKWSFHHIPTLIQHVRNETLDIWVMWAILALSIRFVNEAPAPFVTPIEASNAFAAHTRQLLLPSMESPSLSRLQALLMIVGHSWGAGDGAKAWLYMGTAARMMQVLNLNEEIPPPADRATTREDFIFAEERRRVAWTCFLMDSLLSGGQGRKRSLSADDMRIQLPCERDCFYFGDAVKCEWLRGPGPQLQSPRGDLGILAHSLRAADFWGEVALWACSDTMKHELPWNRDSQYQLLLQRIESWKSSLPSRIQYSSFTLHAHSANEQGQAFIYMWAIYDMARLFLHRSYLPVLGQVGLYMDPDVDSANPSGKGTRSEWDYWLKHSRRELFTMAATICDMMQEMRTFGVYFLRGLVPWTGFSIYTAVGVMLYCYNFPEEGDDRDIVARAKERVANGCSLLQEMRAWPMADTWYENIKRMQAYYQKLKAKGAEAVSPAERENFTNSLIDYGHLQSPSARSVPPGLSVPGSVSSAPTPDQLVVTVPTPPSASLGGPSPASGDGIPAPSPPSPFVEAPQSEVLAYIWEEKNPFNFDYDFNVADFDAIMEDATLNFWNEFPGEASFVNFA